VPTCAHHPQQDLRVGFYGNNLNLAFNVVLFLSRAGFNCTWLGFTKSSADPQDSPSWQGSSFQMLRRRIILGDNPLFNPLSSEYPTIKSKIATACRDLDILFLSEDGPCWFYEQRLPKIFVSQGGDLQDFPFFIQRALQQLFARPTILFSASPRSSSVYSSLSCNVSYKGRTKLFTPYSNLCRVFLAKLLRQYYQRRGLRLCDKLFITPNQLFIIDRLRIPPSKVYFAPLPSFSKYISRARIRRPPNDALDIVKTITSSHLVLFSPTRILLGSKSKPYAKHNDYLIKSLKLLSIDQLSRLKLVLVRKGTPCDLSAIDSLIVSLRLTQHILWIPPQPSFHLVNFYKLDNLIICDQYSSNIAYLGAIGREASLHGKLLLTAFSHLNSFYYGADLPPHVFPCFTPEDIASSIVSILSLDKSQLNQYSLMAKQWFMRWHSPSASVRKFIYSSFPH